MADKKSLYQQALDAGLTVPDYDDITGRELEELLDSNPAPEADTDAKADTDVQKSSGLKVKNLQKNPVEMRGLSIAPDGTAKLTEAQANDSVLMAKIQHGVRTGVYKIA